MVAVIIMAEEANNHGNNIKWSLVVVLEGGCCFICGCFLGGIDVGGLFLSSCRPPCLQLYPDSASALAFSWGYLII